MRTVTFSDTRVAAALARDFILTWKNIWPEKVFREGANEKLDQLLARDPQKEILPEGAGATNICSIFALPDGRIVHAVQGYVRPSRFLEEIAFAQEAAKAAREKDSSTALKLLYERRLKSLDAENRSVRGSVEKLALSPLPPIQFLLESKTTGLR